VDNLDKNTKTESLNTTIYILKSLKSSELYGYEIIEKVNILSQNKLNIKQATLYTNLKKLEQKKYISSYWKDSDIGGKRHYYYITDAGIKYLENCENNSETNDNVCKSNKEEPNKEPSNIEIISIGANSFSNSSKTFWNNNGNEKSNLTKSNSDALILKNEDKQNDSNLSNLNDGTINTVSTPTKSDAHILTDDEVIETSYNAISMENRPINSASTLSTDIDYKGILNELYSNTNSVEEKNVLHNSIQNNVSSNTITTQNIDDTSTFDNTSINNNTNNELEHKEKRNVKLNAIYDNFDNYKIKVKEHNKLYKIKINSGEYLQINKMNLFLSIFVYFCFAVLVGASYLLFSATIEGLGDVLIICLLVGLLYPIVYTTIYLFNKHKRKRNSYNFISSILTTIILVLVLMIFIISICFLTGMTDVNQSKYIYYWLIPAIVGLTAIMSCLIKNILIKSNKFDC